MIDYFILPIFLVFGANSCSFSTFNITINIALYQIVAICQGFNFFGGGRDGGDTVLKRSFPPPSEGSPPPMSPPPLWGGSPPFLKKFPLREHLFFLEYMFFFTLRLILLWKYFRNVCRSIKCWYKAIAYSQFNNQIVASASRAIPPPLPNMNWKPCIIMHVHFHKCIPIFNVYNLTSYVFFPSHIKILLSECMWRLRTRYQV